MGARPAARVSGASGWLQQNGRVDGWLQQLAHFAGMDLQGSGWAWQRSPVEVGMVWQRVGMRFEQMVTCAAWKLRWQLGNGECGMQQGHVGAWLHLQVPDQLPDQLA